MPFRKNNAKNHEGPFTEGGSSAMNFQSVFLCKTTSTLARLAKCPNDDYIDSDCRSSTGGPVERKTRTR